MAKTGAIDQLFLTKFSIFFSSLVSSINFLIAILFETLSFLEFSVFSVMITVFSLVFSKTSSRTAEIFSFSKDCFLIADTSLFEVSFFLFTNYFYFI
jgi:ABC-type proline/glycine betaine transport system permease subunit